MDDITLEQFLDDEKDRLARFAVFWRKMAQQEPDAFPLAMPAGDWDEQYATFVDEDHHN